MFMEESLIDYASETQIELFNSVGKGVKWD